MMSVGVLLKYFIYSAIITLAYSLTVYKPTSTPRITEFSSSTAEPGSPAASPSPNDYDDASYYRLINGETNSTCSLLKTDGLVEVKFELQGVPEQADSFIPSKVLVEGNCTEEDTSIMRLSWTGYSLVINFSKTPGGEKWYVSNVELTASPDLPQFYGIKTQGKPIRLYHRQMLMSTPTGRSFKCHEVEVPLTTDKDDHPPPGVNGSIFLRQLQVEPFMYRNEDFSKAFECKS